MKFVIAVIIIVGLSMGGYQFYNYWLKFKDKSSDSAPVEAAAPVVNGDSLPGLPEKLQQPYAMARQRGASGMHDFLAAYGDQIQDPRRASIELDYIELLSQSSPGEARAKFHEVQTRVQPDSPVYPRIQQLAKTYQ